MLSVIQHLQNTGFRLKFRALFEIEGHVTCKDVLLRQKLYSGYRQTTQSDCCIVF